jgi:hypothetical protein
MVIGAVILSLATLVFVAVTTRFSRSSMFSENEGAVCIEIKRAERIVLFISLIIIIPHNEVNM